jgi:predicted RNA-binding Zn-ribbon protein involved in translation (DUF1610 family)
MSSEYCPDCGDYLHRSHSRGFSEKLIKNLTRSRIYRCHECGWRGWIASGHQRGVSPLLQKLLPLGITIFATILITLLAIYFARYA